VVSNQEAPCQIPTAEPWEQHNAQRLEYTIGEPDNECACPLDCTTQSCVEWCVEIGRRYVVALWAVVNRAAAMGATCWELADSGAVTCTSLVDGRIGVG